MPERESDKLIKKLLEARDPNEILSTTTENAQASRLMAAHTVWDLLRRAGVIDDPTSPMAKRRNEQAVSEAEAIDKFSPLVLAKFSDRPSSQEASDHADPRLVLTEQSATYPIIVRRTSSDGHWSDPYDTMLDTETTWYGFLSPEDAHEFVDMVGTEFEEPSFGGDDPYGYRTSHYVEVNPWFVDEMLAKLER